MLGPKCYSLGDQVTYDLTELTVAINVASVTVSPSAHMFLKPLETVGTILMFSLKPWRLSAQY